MYTIPSKPSIFLAVRFLTFQWVVDKELERKEA
jgi:hypothetical protein